MKKPCRKYAPNASTRPLLDFSKLPKTAIACKQFFYKSDILNKDHQKPLKKLTLFFFRNACCMCVTCKYSYVNRMSLVCHLHVTCLYSHVICMSHVCTCMSTICHTYVLVCHPYVTRLWFFQELVLVQ